ncbi:MAG: hydroxyproline-2-epimerase [Gammaproteobacteria bacterium]|nr:hydroxyproline-2-epimerase [Gammaproteobacteria bacterium]MYJ74470.1 hydroxyproline-2-epimerase [Gammaproteobacteria bacterium]
MVGLLEWEGPVSKLRVVDSHTAGEPTRVVVSGGPDLGDGPLAQRLGRLKARHDDFRRSVILEPRGSDALVGALLCAPTDPSCAAAVIFFNNVGYLNMCGHGAIGVAVTLAYLERVEVGELCLETPVGIVAITLRTPNEVTIENVPSYRFRPGVAVDVEGVGTVRGDVAWGGNWFFLVDATSIAGLSSISLEAEPELTETAKRIKAALVQEGVTGRDGAQIDHIELFGPPVSPDAHGRNFVLCPGDAYDRSPCGTGTSAKVACLAADGALQPGEDWVQESLIGSRFVSRYRRGPSGEVIPRIAGEAFVCGDNILIRNPQDPFRNGIG